MKKILFFDCWTKGVKFIIAPLAKQFPQSQYQVKLFHFESIYNPSFPKYKKIEGLKCYDFSYYKTFNLRKVFKREKPDLVIFFDKRGLLDRAGVRAANFLNIPTLQIQHGAESSLSSSATPTFYQNPYGFAFYLKNTPRILKMFLIYFITSLASDKIFLFRPKTFYYLFQLFRNPHAHYLLYSDEVKCQKIAVYGEKDREYYMKRDGYLRNEVVVIGNFFLDKTCRLARKRGRSKFARTKTPSVLLLTKPYVEDNQFGWTEKTREKTVKEIYKIISKFKFYLTLKLHPREKKESYRFLSKKKDLRIVKDVDLDKIILDHDLILSFYSTSLYNVVLLKKPLILINWVPRTPLTADFSCFGVARRADSLEEFRRYLEDFKKREFFPQSYQEKREKFIKQFLYKDDGKAAERLVALVKRMVRGET